MQQQTEKKEELNLQKLYLSTAEYCQDQTNTYEAFLKFFNNSLHVHHNIEETVKNIELLEHNKKRIKEGN
jgi:hypothetical protein